MKRDDKLFSIGEIAKALGVTRRIILHYEERGLIGPDKRDEATNNRYYTIDTFTKLRSIRSLQNLGLTLDEIRNYYNDSTDLMPLIRRMEEMRDQLNLNIEKLYERAKVSSAQVKELELPQQLIYPRTYRSNNVADKTVLLRNTALEAMRAHGTDITRRMYFIQFPIDRPAEVSCCVAVPPGSEGEYVETAAPMRAICIYHHGAYEELPAVGFWTTPRSTAWRRRASCAIPIWRGRPSIRTPQSSSLRSFCQSCNGISHSAYLHTRQSCLRRTP